MKAISSDVIFLIIFYASFMHLYLTITLKFNDSVLVSEVTNLILRNIYNNEYTFTCSSLQLPTK